MDFRVRLAHGSYFFTPGGGTGTRVTPGHFPLPVLLPVSRPEASRWEPVTVPVDLLVVSLPVRRPEASLNCVLLLAPANLVVSAVAAKRPEASRYMVLVVLPLD